ncbi:MAG: hypothetical protein AAGA48_28255 [Myxococcota bacterium]
MLWWAFSLGCQLEGTPVVDARGGGVAYWPAHSRTAVEGAIEAAFSSLEIDLTPTADGQWVGQGGATWQDCIDTRTNLPAEPAAVVEWDQDATQLLRCGGTPQPEWPNALVVAEAPLTLQGLIQLVRESDLSEQRIHLHLRSADLPSVAQLFDVWAPAELPNALHVSADELVTLEAVETEARRRNLEVHSTLRLFDEMDNSAPAVGPLVNTKLWEQLQMQEADGLALPAFAWSRQRLRRAQEEGIAAMALDADDPSTWSIGLDSVLTAFPGDLVP